MKLKKAAKKVEDSIEETLTYMEFPYEHWLRIRTNREPIRCMAKCPCTQQIQFCHIGI